MNKYIPKNILNPPKIKASSLYLRQLLLLDTNHVSRPLRHASAQTGSPTMTPPTPVTTEGVVSDNKPPELLLFFFLLPAREAGVVSP